MKRLAFLVLLALGASGAAAQEPRNVRFQGAPRIGSEQGWSLKPRGRLQYDFGHIETIGSVDELRRARIGVEGTAPGGFDYVFEIDVAPEVIEIADAYVRYKVSDRIRLTAGQHNNFQSLEELTSSLQTSFIERAAFTDAFNFERRLGVSGTYVDGPLTAQLGIFHENFLDVDETDDAVSLDGRLVYAPRLGTTQLHLAGSAHWRDNGPATATRYRQRPLLHATDVRFVATPSLAVTGETHFGLEAAMIRGPLHLAGEAHWLDPDTAGGSASPTLFGAYLEAGYFLTGETRGYRGARWDRTRVRQGGAIEEGGFGAVQVAVRWDYLDLASGGRQSGLQAALTWIPTDHVRFMLNYARLDYDDAAVPAAGGERDYAVDVVGVRAQLDW